jgi:hypothetical protein
MKLRDILKEIDETLSKHEKYQLLKLNKAIVVYRGVHESGKNFYQGENELPFTYYALTKSKAKEYGKVTKYIFNGKEQSIRIFKGSDLFTRFGLNGNIENNEVIDDLINSGYSAALIKGDELVVFDRSLIELFSDNE